MNETARYVPLETVVKHYMSEANLTGAHYMRLYHLGHRGLIDIGIDITQEVKTEKLPVEANKTVVLPEDYIQWVKVGVLNEQGEVATLRRNDNLTKWGALDSNRLNENTGPGLRPDLQFYGDVYQNYHTTGSLFNLFGVRSNMDYYGEFRVDDASGVILLDNDFRYSEVILEYVSNPTLADDLVIPIQAQEALIAFIRWMDIQSLPSSRRVTTYEKQTRRREYYNQRRLTRARLQPMRLWDTNETIRINNNIVLKA